jgi:hypothetical protein
VDQCAGVPLRHDWTCRVGRDNFLYTMADVDAVIRSPSHSNAGVNRWIGGIVASQRMMLFYNARTRAGATARIGDGGVLRDERDISQVALGLWTHLVA